MAKRNTEAEFVMTPAGQLLGSPAYMSPEQWQDSHAVDRRTDLWAVGVILFERLTGERPFRAERDTKLLMQQILNAAPPPPSPKNSTASSTASQSTPAPSPNGNEPGSGANATQRSRRRSWARPNWDGLLIGGLFGLAVVAAMFAALSAFD